MFRDVTSLMADPAAFRVAVASLADAWRFNGKLTDIDLVAGIEARGFIFGAAVAVELDRGFIPLRKPNKLPGPVIGEDYTLEYGTDRLELHAADVPAGARVLIIDDLIATGGTAVAAAHLIERAGAKVAGLGFVVDLPMLGGKQTLIEKGHKVHALMDFDGH